MLNIILILSMLVVLAAYLICITKYCRATGWNPFKRKCKHKKFEAIESFVCKTNLFYHRLIIYKCKDCGIYAYTDGHALMHGSGALDLHRPVLIFEYVAHGSMYLILSHDEYVKQVSKLLEKYFGYDVPVQLENF